MGSDLAPQALYDAVSSLSKEDPSCTFVVIGKDLTINDKSNVEHIFAPDVIEMDESPLVAVRRKKDSSMAIGIQLLKEKKIDAFLSLGNTGALVGFSRLKLPLLPSISTLSLLVLLPKEQGKVAVLDVGANISFKPQHLVEYAKLGRIYAKVAEGIAEPTVGLLNIGVEEKKGTLFAKEGYRILSDYFSGSKGIFLGNIEGKEVFQKGVDVLITDGFTGNVFLKTCEGVSAFLIDYFKRQVDGNGGFQTLLHAFQKKFNYSQHPGALLCGVEGLVVKCHGYSDIAAFMTGVKGMVALAKLEIVQKMKEELQR